MGVSLLPEELLLLTQQWPCRETQLRQLASLLPNDNSPSPSTIVVHGPCATGKSSILSAYLEQQKTRYAIIKCRECTTGRHLLERTVAAVHHSLRTSQEDEDTNPFNPRCENLSALVVHLQRLLNPTQGTFILVFDGIDKQRDPPPTLLPALARLSEFVPSLSTLLIVQYASPHSLHKPGVPHVHFAPYTRNQSIHILSSNPLPIFEELPADKEEYDDEVHAEDMAWLWPRFCAAVWDSLGQAVARDLVAFRSACNKLWRPFVAPIVKGEFGTRDFTRLVVRQRGLFQEEGVLLDTIVPVQQQATALEKAVPAKSKAHELPYYAKWLLIAAYLASFTPPKMDSTLFMKSTDRRKKRKKGGGTSARGANRISQARKIPRHLLAPAAFGLDRWLSILHAVLPHDLRAGVDVLGQVATLAGLRLVVKGGPGGGGVGGGAGDSLERGGKWRVGGQVGWEVVLGLAREVGFDVREYVVE